MPLKHSSALPPPIAPCAHCMGGTGPTEVSHWGTVVIGQFTLQNLSSLQIPSCKKPACSATLPQKDAPFVSLLLFSPLSRSVFSSCTKKPQKTKGVQEDKSIMQSISTIQYKVHVSFSETTCQLTLTISHRHTHANSNPTQEVLGKHRSKNTAFLTGGPPQVCLSTRLLLVQRDTKSLLRGAIITTIRRPAKVRATPRALTVWGRSAPQ